MSRASKVYVGISIFYGVGSWFDIGWFAIPYSLILAGVVMAALVVVPKMHKWVFGEKYFKISVAPDQPIKESE